MRAKTPRSALALVMCVLLVAVAGCLPADQAFVLDLAMDWARVRGVAPLDEEGNVDIMGGIALAAAALKRAGGGTTGDPELDAVLDVYNVINTMNQADKLMGAARDNRDADAMDSAIEMRPGDWTYRVSRAVLALEQGDVAMAEQQSEQAWDLAGESPAAQERVLDQSIGELEVMRNALGAAGNLTGNRCRAVYNQLNAAYARRGFLANSDEDAMNAATYASMSEGCPD